MGRGTGRRSIAVGGGRGVAGRTPARFVTGLGTVDRVDALPFDKLGAAKCHAPGQFRAHGLTAC
jgi:hypothetical protein